MKTVQEILNLSASYLKQKGIPHARRQAEELLSDVLGISRLQIYMDFDRPLSEGEVSQCRDKLARKAKREPMQYIRGEVEFYNCAIKVTRDVLIPRQETELLIDMIVKKLAKEDLSYKGLWDVCCGSGAIGIALKKQFPALNVVMSDISTAALAIAKENAERNQVNVTFLEGDLLKPFEGKLADFVVCNPPYVSEEEYHTLESEVKDYEPSIALIGGKTGLEYYYRLAQELKGKLNPQGNVWLEIGSKQADAVITIFKDAGWDHCVVERDWAGNDRFFILEHGGKLEQIWLDPLG